MTNRMLVESRGLIVLCALAVAVLAMERSTSGEDFLQKPISNAALAIAHRLVNGEGRLQLLYIGNSRRGFAMNGAKPFLREHGRLLGTNESVVLATSDAPGYRSLYFDWQKPPADVAENFWPVQVNTPGHGVAILSEGGWLLLGPDKDIRQVTDGKPLVYTVGYRTGPNEGIFRVTPVLIDAAGKQTDMPASGNVEIRTIDAKRPGEPTSEFLRLSLPAGTDGSVCGLRIDRVEGTCHILEASVRAEAESGIVVAQWGTGGHGFQNQMRTDPGGHPRCRRQDYVKSVAAFDPDVLVLMMADNQRSPVWVEATRELIGRVREARKGKPFLTILQIDNRSPRGNAVEIIEESWTKMRAVHDQEPDLLILNPDVHLPADWSKVGSSNEKSAPSFDPNFTKYFRDGIHENPAGQRAVFDGLWKELERFVKATPLPKEQSP